MRQHVLFLHILGCRLIPYFESFSSLNYRGFLSCSGKKYITKEAKTACRDAFYKVVDYFVKKQFFGGLLLKKSYYSAIIKY